MVLETLVGSQNLLETRYRNKTNEEKTDKITDTYKKTKTITVMFHFNESGCKIGMTALQKKQKLQ